METDVCDKFYQIHSSCVPSIAKECLFTHLRGLVLTYCRMDLEEENISTNVPHMAQIHLICLAYSLNGGVTAIEMAFVMRNVFRCLLVS